MDRRDFVKQLSAGMGAALTPGVLGAILSGCQPNGESTGLVRPDEGRIFLDDREITGEPMYKRAQAGIGYLAQEPQLDESKDVKGNVEEGIAALKQLVDRFNEVSQKFAEPMSDDEMTDLLAEQGKLQGYLYVILGGETYDSVVQKLKASYILQSPILSITPSTSTCIPIESTTIVQKVYRCMFCFP